MINITLNDKKLSVEDDKTILQICAEQGINIPTFCHDDRLKAEGSCRICIVELAGSKDLAISCSLAAKNGMNIQTHSPKVMKMRKRLLELMMSNHDENCLTCEKSGKCLLQNYCYEYGVDVTKYRGKKREPGYMASNKFFYLNQGKCILCRKCARVCEQLQGNRVLSTANKGFNTEINTPFEIDMEEGNCVSCGNCVSNCPVGALMPKTEDRFRYWDVKRTATICQYCGVGCRMNLLTKGEKVVGVEPINVGVNEGLLCVKGKFGYHFVNHSDRLTDPLIKKDGKFVKASWEEAYALIAKRFGEIKAAHGPDSIGVVASAKITVEENFLAQKFARTVIGTNNIDHCARLCHATSVTALAGIFGSGAMTNPMGDIGKGDVIFLTGSNPTDAHPVVGSFLEAGVKKGAKLIVADPRRIPLADIAEIYMPHYSGSDIALYNGILHHIIKNDLVNKQFIEERTEGYDDLLKIIDKYTPEYCSEITGVPAADIIRAAEMFAKGPRSMFVFGMGVAQHANAVDAVCAMANVAMVTGMIGRPYTGINPLRGQVNVQGACDMGCLPHFFPGYQPSLAPANKEKFESAWGVKLADTQGWTVSEMFEHGLKGMYIVGANPIIANPDVNSIKERLKEMDFLVVQDMFLTDTAEFADVVLPAASFAEKYGCVTNSERRIQFQLPAIKPVGNSKPDWRILLDVMASMGYENKAQCPETIMDEIASLVPQYAGVSHEKIRRFGDTPQGVRWPIKPEDNHGTAVLHSVNFPRGKGLIKPIEYSPPAEETDEEYPTILTTGRMLYQFHTMTMSGLTEGIMKIAPGGFMEMSPQDAQSMNIKDGETVCVKSRRGEIKAKVKVTGRIKDGVVFIPFHFKDTHVNIITNPAYDPAAKEPELKVCAVKIEKVS